MGMGCQSLADVVVLYMIGIGIQMEMAMRRLKGSDQQCRTKRECADPAHCQILTEPRWARQLSCGGLLYRSDRIG